MRIVTDEVKNQVYEWIDTHHFKRTPKSKYKLAQKLGISVQTIYNLKVARELEEAGLSQKENALSNLVMQFSDEELWAFKRRVYDKAMTDKASAKDRELFGKMEGLLVDKSETKVRLELDTSEVIRRNLAAERELTGHGVEEVQTGVQGAALLHDELRLDSGQSETSGSEVAAVGTPG